MIAIRASTRHKTHHPEPLLERPWWALKTITASNAAANATIRHGLSLKLSLQFLIPTRLVGDQLLEVANIIDRFAEDDALVGLVGRVDVALGQERRQFLDLFVDVIASASFNYW